MPGPILQFQRWTGFQWMYDDRGIGSQMNGSFYRPTGVPDGWFILGDYGQGNYDPPNGSVLIVSLIEDDPRKPALVAPHRWYPVWADHGTNKGNHGSFWQPIAPAGYVACGHVAQKGYEPPDYDPSDRLGAHGRHQFIIR
jgi:hypothetical protein